MPAFQHKLTNPGVDAVLTYIKTWWTPDQRDGQADISQRYQEALDRQKKHRRIPITCLGLPGAGKRSGPRYSSRMADSTLARMSWGISLIL